MDENPASALQYGHLGKAIYVPDSRSWAFFRTLEQPSLISYFGITKQTIPSSLTASRLSSPENSSLLPSLHPDLAACWSSVSDERLSRAILTASELCDPRVSQLFDLGHAVNLDKDNYGSGVVPIAVVATGECRNHISFRKVEEDVAELTQSTYQASARLRIPCVGDTDRTEWSAGTASVRQVCFAQTIEEPATWVAARFTNSTNIFRPLYNQTRVAVHIDRGNCYATQPDFLNSHLEANLLIEISSSHTGGFAHADVTFNPWYPKQIGIVDEGGNWSIWEFSGYLIRNKGDWNATCTRLGALPWVDLDGSRGPDSRIRLDGWAAIEWAGDVNSFVVADRCCLMLYRMENDQIRTHAVELGLERKSEWILDIKRSQSEVTHLFVLTTTRILWLDLSHIFLAPNEMGSCALSPRLSWYHFRDMEDTTLRLSSVLINEDLYLLLYSRLNRLVLAFQCRMPLGSQMGAMHVPDPFVLDVPSVDDVQVSGPEAQFSCLVLKKATSSIGRRPHELDARLLKLFVLNSSLALNELVYVGPTRESSMEEQRPGQEVLWSKRPLPGRRVARFAHEFVVDDWDESVFGPGALTKPQSFVSTTTPLMLPAWTIDFTTLYAVATGRLTIASKVPGTEQAPRKNFGESLEQLKDIISSAELSARPTSSTILELLGKSPQLDDIDRNARDLHQLCSISLPQNQRPSAILPHSLSSYLSTYSVGLEGSSAKLDLVDTYDSLVSDWLSKLSHNIPARTRIMKDKVLRSVAVDLVLAQINIYLSSSGGEASHSEVPSKTLKDSELSGLADDIESSKTTASDWSGVNNDQRPRKPGISSSQTTPATIPNSQGPTIGAAQRYSSLASLTTFNNQQSMSRDTAAVLSHWQPGTNPATYSWQPTVQEPESENETSRMASRAGSQRKSSRSRYFASQTPPATPSVFPAVRSWGSQPDGAAAPVKVESSQLLEEDLPMTQVERGVYGGREPVKKSSMRARKKRAAGF